jgi:uncharacterized protein with HEPN domain
LRDKKLYAQDIIESIDAIFEHIEGYEFDEFKNDRKTYQAVLKEFEIIGEAMKNIKDEVKRCCNDFDYRPVIAFRNVLVHEYFGIRFKTVWDLIFYELPKLKKTIEKLIKEL